MAHLDRQRGPLPKVKTEEDEAYEGDIKGIKRRLDFENMSMLTTPKSNTMEVRAEASRRVGVLVSESSKAENLKEEEESREASKPLIRPCEMLIE